MAINFMLEDTDNSIPYITYAPKIGLGVYKVILRKDLDNFIYEAGNAKYYKFFCTFNSDLANFDINDSTIKINWTEEPFIKDVASAGKARKAHAKHWQNLVLSNYNKENPLPYDYKKLGSNKSEETAKYISYLKRMEEDLYHKPDWQVEAYLEITGIYFSVSNDRIYPDYYSKVLDNVSETPIEIIKNSYESTVKSYYHANRNIKFKGERKPIKETDITIENLLSLTTDITPDIPSSITDQHNPSDVDVPY